MANEGPSASSSSAELAVRARFREVRADLHQALAAALVVTADGAFEAPTPALARVAAASREDRRAAAASQKALEKCSGGLAPDQLVDLPGCPVTSWPPVAQPVVHEAVAAWLGELDDRLQLERKRRQALGAARELAYGHLQDLEAAGCPALAELWALLTRVDQLLQQDDAEGSAGEPGAVESLLQDLGRADRWEPRLVAFLRSLPDQPGPPEPPLLVEAVSLLRECPPQLDPWLMQRLLGQRGAGRRLSGAGQPAPTSSAEDLVASPASSSTPSSPLVTRLVPLSPDPLLDGVAPAAMAGEARVETGSPVLPVGSGAPETDTRRPSEAERRASLQRLDQQAVELFDDEERAHGRLAALASQPIRIPPEDATDQAALALLARECFLARRPLEAAVLSEVAGNGGWALAPPSPDLCKLAQLLDTSGLAGFDLGELVRLREALRSTEEHCAASLSLAPSALAEERFDLLELLDLPEPGARRGGLDAIAELLAALQERVLVGQGGGVGSDLAPDPATTLPAATTFAELRAALLRVAEEQRTLPEMKTELGHAMISLLSSDLRALESALAEDRWPPAKFVEFWKDCDGVPDALARLQRRAVRERGAKDHELHKPDLPRVRNRVKRLLPPLMDFLAAGPPPPPLVGAVPLHDEGADERLARLAAKARREAEVLGKSRHLAAGYALKLAEEALRLASGPLQLP